MLVLRPEAVKLWRNLPIGILGNADGGWAKPAEQGTTAVQGGLVMGVNTA